MFPRYSHVIILVASAVLSAGCVHRVASVDSPPPPIASQAEDLHILSGEWEYIDDGTGTAVLLTLNEQGNGHYGWKSGRFETDNFIDHTWSGMWFQDENDREGGFTVEFSPDFSEGEGQWWYSRIGSDHSPTQKGGTFHLRAASAG